MKKLLLVITAVMISSALLAQDSKVTRKIQIRSADPLLIAILLSGQQNFQGSPVPTSLVRLGNGTSGGFGGMNGGGLAGGRGNGL
jgi:hypothetical protein